MGPARDARSRGRLLPALDADSEGEEGRFYVWDEAEMREALTEAGLAADAIERRSATGG